MAKVMSSGGTQRMLWTTRRRAITTYGGHRRRRLVGWNCGFGFTAEMGRLRRGGYGEDGGALV